MTPDRSRESAFRLCQRRFGERSDSKSSPKRVKNQPEFCLGQESQTAFQLRDWNRVNLLKLKSPTGEKGFRQGNLPHRTTQDGCMGDDGYEGEIFVTREIRENEAGPDFCSQTEVHQPHFTAPACRHEWPPAGRVPEKRGPRPERQRQERLAPPPTPAACGRWPGARRGSALAVHRESVRCSHLHSVTRGAAFQRKFRGFRMNRSLGFTGHPPALA